jgi:uncharacterized protein (TIGR03000 family)
MMGTPRRETSSVIRPTHSEDQLLPCLCLEKEQSFHPYVSKEFRMKKFVCLAAFGLVALFVASPSRAAAGSWGISGISIGGLGGYTGWSPLGVGVGWGRYRAYDWYGYPRFYRRDWGPVYYYPVTRTSYYYPPTQEQAVDANAVTLRMHVPSDARVSIEDVAMSQSGADRSFVSPPLTPGRDFVYHIRVQWNENGKAVERKRELTVHAGDRINLTIDK